MLLPLPTEVGVLAEFGIQVCRDQPHSVLSGAGAGVAGGQGSCEQPRSLGCALGALGSHGRDLIRTGTARNLGLGAAQGVAGSGVRAAHVSGELAGAAGPLASMSGQLQGAGLEPLDGGSQLGVQAGCGGTRAREVPPALNGGRACGHEDAKAGRACGELCVESNPARPGASQGDMIRLVHRKLPWAARDGLEGPEWPQGHEGSCCRWTRGLERKTGAPRLRDWMAGQSLGPWWGSRFGGVRANAPCPGRGASWPQSWVRVHTMPCNQQAFPASLLPPAPLPPCPHPR